MLHPPVCGPGELEARQAGFLTFPRQPAPGLGPRGQVECVWDLSVRPNKQIRIQVKSTLSLNLDPCYAFHYEGNLFYSFRFPM